MNRRGVTLVELMIVVVMLSILVGALGSATRQAQLAGLAELQHARALLLLEHHAARAAAGAPTDPGVAARLREGLPGVQVRAEDSGGGTRTLTVTWRDALDRPASRALTVFTP